MEYVVNLDNFLRSINHNNALIHENTDGETYIFISKIKPIQNPYTLTYSNRIPLSFMKGDRLAFFYEEKAWFVFVEAEANNLSDQDRLEKIKG